jgi:hypothetical protein
MGLLVWVLYLAACKRSRQQGTFTFTTEEAAWMELGLADPKDRPDFTLAEFFKYTGQLKQTRQTRLGQLQHVTATHWEEWQETVKRRLEADKKKRQRESKGTGSPRTEARNRRDIPEPFRGSDLDLDLDLDLDQDQDLDQDLARASRFATRGDENPAPRRSTAQRPRDEIWDLLEAHFGPVADGTSAHGCRNKAVTDLKRLGATPDTVRKAISSWPEWFESATLTDAALAKHYPMLASGAPPERNGRYRRGLSADEIARVGREIAERGAAP